MKALVGRILHLAIRDGHRGPMVEKSEVCARENGGIDGDNASRPDRGVTLLASGQWEQVQRELQTELPWHSRRANVLVSAETLGVFIGRVLQIGEVSIHVVGETRPCDLMDQIHPGLKHALTPDYRAGVHGRILRGGVLRVGESVTAADSA